MILIFLLKLSEHDFFLQDMDLIEVLWKQDVDLGFSLENATPKSEKVDVDKKESDAATDKSEDVEKLKALQAVNEDSIKVCHTRVCFFLAAFINVILLAARTIRK